MTKRYLLGIDIGTSSCKLSLYSVEGEMCFHTSAFYPTYFPKRDFAEQRPEEWWKAVKQALRELQQKHPTKMANIVGVGVAGQSGALILLDKDGNVLSPAMIWLDRRSQEECEKWKQSTLAEHIYSVSKNPLSPSYLTSKLAWLHKHQPELLSSTSKLLQSNGYIVYKLTGQYSQDYSQANGLHCFDIQKKQWNYELAEQLKINVDWLPPLMESKQIVGYVSKAIADETLLPEGVPVVAGGLDAACSTFGVGVIDEGQVQEQGGQAGGMSIVTKEAQAHPQLILSTHVTSSAYLLQGGTVGGGSLNWFKRELYMGEEDTFYKHLNTHASRIRAGSEGLIFLPYMSGERSPIWDKKAKGMFVGLTYEKTQAHMLRAILEGCTYALRHNLETAQQLGIHIESLYSVGGASNSALWMQIKSDITHKAVKVAQSSETTTRGAAMLAGMGIGLFANEHEAVRAMVRLSDDIYLPNLEQTDTYEAMYSIYKRIYPTMKSLTDELDGVE